MEEDSDIPLILGRQFLAIGRALTDVHQGELILWVHDEKVTFNVFEAMKHPVEKKNFLRIDLINSLVREVFHQEAILCHLETTLVNAKILKNDYKTNQKLQSVKFLEASLPIAHLKEKEKSCVTREVVKEESPKLELKSQSSTLKYAFLGGNHSYPIIISAFLSKLEEENFLRVLREYTTTIGWTISDLKGISPTMCMHKILLEEDSKPVVQPQRRLNPTMKEVVLKLWDARIIYPIFDKSWVSLVQVGPKKGGITMVSNENNEPIPTIKKMLERLARHRYYYFSDRFLGYNQIVVDPTDQEKIAFTCPYGVFTYQRLPFGLCDALAIFQRCMISIFSIT